MNPYVKAVKPQEDYRLLLTFENDERRVFDLKPYLERPVFQGLQNIALFKSARVVSGSVEWQGNVDLSYDTLYLESKPRGQTPTRHKAARIKKKSVALAGNARKRSSRSHAVVK